MAIRHFIICSAGARKSLAAFHCADVMTSQEERLLITSVGGRGWLQTGDPFSSLCSFWRREQQKRSDSLTSPTGEAYLSEAAVCILIGRAAVGAVTAARLLLLVQQGRGIGQRVLQMSSREQQVTERTQRLLELRCACVPVQRWCAGRFCWWTSRWRRCSEESSNVQSSEDRVMR